MSEILTYECSECKVEVSKDAMLCLNCGADLSETVEEVAKPKGIKILSIMSLIISIFNIPNSLLGIGAAIFMNEYFTEINLAVQLLTILASVCYFIFLVLIFISSIGIIRYKERARSLFVLLLKIAIGFNFAILAIFALINQGVIFIIRYSSGSIEGLFYGLFFGSIIPLILFFIIKYFNKKEVMICFE